MSSYAPLLAALVALLAGLTIGKAWERYKLRDGRWIDRRRARESPVRADRQFDDPQARRSRASAISAPCDNNDPTYRMSVCVTC